MNQKEPKFYKIMRFIFWPFKKPLSNIFYLLWFTFPVGVFIRKPIDDIDAGLILSIVAVFSIFRFYGWSFNKKWEGKRKESKAERKKKKENEPKFYKVMRFIFWPFKKPSSNIFYLLWFVFPIGALSGKSIDDIDAGLILSIVAVFSIFRFYGWSFSNDKNVD